MQSDPQQIQGTPSLAASTAVPPPSLQPLTQQMRNYLAQQDYINALRVANDVEILLLTQLTLPGHHLHISQTNKLCPGDGNPQLLLAVQLLLHLILDDLANARLLWRRIPNELKNVSTLEGRQLSKAWDVGKSLWAREIPAAHVAIRDVQWTPELVPLVDALRERILRDEFALLSRAFRRLRISSMAKKLGVTESEAVAGLPELEQLTKYISFLEAESVTSSVA
ncbi:cop9 constitutive photomorphogenic subunit 8-like protein [Nannochloropsis gaditana CCMP526]|uniref:cop9 constitutive photomorphogenic subunit 8-like protein n=1 Tax=Nannochloropsis gaditana (strain CCMP526) TaxID=1093141 RepID=UPI00029F722B|nr:cop9 constitutive photomorphogenic subunit 8-like protein [Nannochloropsis gaditana CCMP526]EKU22159.1 cop9 constitutive photomorphogenic subunit 8-like protein [Nannochloropsis gaditana CCMP526]|eukprot:XP_005854205.1 cop9 constitutive photomorphogenic subunit 8-like protein [Nannochloropsis gaditana CCMP526]